MCLSIRLQKGLCYVSLIAMLLDSPISRDWQMLTRMPDKPYLSTYSQFIPWASYFKINNFKSETITAWYFFVSIKKGLRLLLGILVVSC